MDDWETPEDVRLSPHERITLLEIEANLLRDRRLAHRMRRVERDLWLRLAVALLALASLFVAVMGIRTSDPALLWCFALLWPLTLLQTFRLLCRAARRRRTGDRTG